jgi:F0F1-type ATP synthase epsilon subunit
MSIWRLVVRELAHRRVNTLLALLAVIAAAGCLVATLTLLRGHDRQTERILTQMQEETKKRTDELTDDYRKIVLKLGFNVFILPAAVRADETYQAGLGGHEMPEAYVEKLAEAGIITIDHLLPSLSAPVFWSEQKRQIVLTGVRGEVAIAGKKRKRPLIQPVEPGQIVLGYQVAKQTGLAIDEQVQLLGETFQVSKIHEARGTADDNTVWIDLKKAQQLLNKEDKITAIQAINCLAPNCHPDETGIPSVTDEIAQVLPDTQVLVDMGKARTRIDARQRAADEAKAALRQEEENRRQVRSQIDRFAALLNPLTIVGAGIWVCLLALINVRERRGEVAILRAIGVTSGSILLVFLGKAVLIGLLGAVLGYACGIAIGGGLSEVATRELFDWRTPLIIMALAPLLVALASWIPALAAANQDPADVLCEE